MAAEANDEQAATPPRVTDSHPVRSDAPGQSPAALFGAAILPSAFLLFLVQPLIGRFVLPWFGGSPGVWTTCMLFFQATLLGGYAYAHLLARYVPPRGQAAAHIAVLALSLLSLPIIPAAGWRPVDGRDPSGRIVLLLAATIGLPYLALSATSPLLQSWLARSWPRGSPYRLFALSNLGSLGALFAYPLVVEPYLTRRQQAWAWSGGMAVFAAVCAACAAAVWRRAGREDVAPLAESPGATSGTPRGRVFLWLALPFCASVLLLATTNTLTQDVAVVPFLWVLPLALYLVTFVVAFDGPRWYPRRVVVLLLPLCALWVARLYWFAFGLGLAEQLAGYLTILFVACLFCHGELARLRPDPRRLTGYYLAIALGGALGGVFVALVAPRLFVQFTELPLAMAAVPLLGLWCLILSPPPGRVAMAGALALAAGLILGLLLMGGPIAGDERVIARTRNFYGALSVVETTPRDAAGPVRIFRHGHVNHGTQYLDPAKWNVPFDYYLPDSGLGRLMAAYPRQRDRKIGVLGLGAGVLAAFAKPGDVYRFYEINPDVETMARKYFTFLKNTPATADVVLGDGRLSLEREPSQQFDVLVMDAFTGDAIPIHLLTTEAFDTYLRHLKPDGVLAVHISNRFVDLYSVVLRQVEHVPGLRAASFVDASSHWMLLTRDPSFWNLPRIAEAARHPPVDPAVGRWTDDHIDLLRVVHWRRRE